MKVFMLVMLSRLFFYADTIVGMGLGIMMLYIGGSVLISFHGYERSGESSMSEQVMGVTIVAWFFSMVMAGGIWMVIAELKKMIRGYEERNNGNER